MSEYYIAVGRLCDDDMDEVVALKLPDSAQHLDRDELDEIAGELLEHNLRATRPEDSTREFYLEQTISLAYLIDNALEPKELVRVLTGYEAVSRYNKGQSLADSAPEGSVSEHLCTASEREIYLQAFADSQDPEDWTEAPVGRETWKITDGTGGFSSVVFADEQQLIDYVATLADGDGSKIPSYISSLQAVKSYLNNRDGLELVTSTD